MGGRGMRAMPEPIERVRMALADTPSLGWGPEHVHPSGDPATSFHFSPDMPLEVAWLAREAALIRDPVCFACGKRASDVAWETGVMPPTHCAATRRFIKDCGVAR